jgi:hypothetical protein
MRETIFIYTLLGIQCKEKYLKLTQYVSKSFKLTQNISRNLFISLHNYIMDEQWMDFIHVNEKWTLMDEFHPF